MCIAVVLALILLPFGGGMFGYARGGVNGAWIGAIGGLIAALVLAGAPTWVFLSAEKKKYDRNNAEQP